MSPWPYRLDLYGLDKACPHLRDYPPLPGFVENTALGMAAGSSECMADSSIAEAHATLPWMEEQSDSLIVV